MSPSLVGEICQGKHVSEPVDSLELTAPYPVHNFGTGKRGRSPAVQSHAVAGRKWLEDKSSGFNRNLSTYVESDCKLSTFIYCLSLVFVFHCLIYCA